jgi:hypothetical protein
LILEFAIVILMIAFFIVIIAILMGRRPEVTDFETKQRANHGSGQIGRPPTDLSTKISEGVGMATDLEYLKGKVGGTGSMEGELHVGTEPEPRRVRVKVSKVEVLPRVPGDLHPRPAALRCLRGPEDLGLLGAEDGDARVLASVISHVQGTIRCNRGTLRSEVCVPGRGPQTGDQIPAVVVLVHARDVVVDGVS